MTIDRIAPTKRPSGRNQGTQRWESLLFCHWEITLEEIRPLVPKGLEIDLFDGSAFVGLVPFKMRAIRPPWLPKQLAFNFYETNVRTYVTHNGRPCVYFFSCDASSFLAVQAARLGWSLPYIYAKMSHQDFPSKTAYECRRNSGSASSYVEFSIGEQMGHAKSGSLEHFLFERYLLYVERKGSISVGQVHHSPYEVYQAEVLRIEDTLVQSAGFANPTDRPALTHFSPGVDVEIFGVRPAGE